MRKHIIGSNGYIGNMLIKHFGPSSPIVKYSHNPDPCENYLELTNPDSFDFLDIQPNDYVIFLAAVSSPEICKNKFDFAYSINVTGTVEYIKRFLERNAKVLFFSSDTVIGATVSACDENCDCKPLGAYAQMKREIEERFMGNAQFKAFRLSYVFSKNDKYTNYLCQCDKEGRTAEVFDSLKRNVIYLNDVFEAVDNLERRFYEFSNTIFNLSGPDLLSRKDLAEIYRQTVSPHFCYCLTEPLAGFFDARPEVIETSSLFLSDLLERKPTAIPRAFMREFDNSKL
jgi:dTDP-4-dehydrorhamnose reductase